MGFGWQCCGRIGSWVLTNVPLWGGYWFRGNNGKEIVCGVYGHPLHCLYNFS